MMKLKRWALSGVVISLAATGLALAQQADPVVTPPGAPPAAASPGPSTPAPVPAPMTDDDDLTPAAEGDEAVDDLGDEAVDSEIEPLEEPGEPAATNEAEDGRPAEGRGRAGGRMGRMDMNRDGTIEKSEFMGLRAERLQAADTDGDGFLSPQELEAMVLKQIAERRAKRMARRLDIDGDGKVSLVELESMRAKRFAVIDRNDDGRIDRRELREMHRGVGHGGMERGERGGRRHEMRHGPRGERHGRHGERHGRHGGEGHHRGYGGEMTMPGGDRGTE